VIPGSKVVLMFVAFLDLFLLETVFEYMESGLATSCYVFSMRRYMDRTTSSTRN